MQESFPQERENPIFPIPFTNMDLENNIIISTVNSPLRDTDELINLALTLHSQGNTIEAKKYYEQIINLEIYDPRIFNNYAAILNKERNVDKAIKLYQRSINLFPKSPEAYSNLGSLLRKNFNLKEAAELEKKAIYLNPNIPDFHYNLSKTLIALNKLKEAEIYINKAININPKSPDYLHLLGLILKKKGNLKEAESHLKEALKLNPNLIDSYINLGSIYIESLNFEEAEKYIIKAIKLDSSLAISHYNLGAVYSNIGRNKAAKDEFLKALEINPKYSIASWNLYGLATSFEEAEMWLNKCLDIDEDYIDAKISICAIKLHHGEKELFNNLMKTKIKDHILMRSIKWVTTLPEMPKLVLNKLDFYNYVINKSVKSRTFYEFGVCRGISFKYLMNSFKKGYGFDTFKGLPEDWNNRYKKGSFSTEGIIPNIKGGTFIAGKFEDTLPEFFKQTRPLASIINFDSDLYSSTLCALNHCKKIIDEKTILIFDDFLNNTNWEEYEYKAINDFCSLNNLKYKVIAVSYFTRQVAIRLILPSCH